MFKLSELSLESVDISVLYFFYFFFFLTELEIELISYSTDDEVVVLEFTFWSLLFNIADGPSKVITFMLKESTHHQDVADLVMYLKSKILN